MKRLIFAFMLIVAAAHPGFAHQFEKDGIVIKHPWTRATAPGAVVGVGYLTITNSGKAADRLVGGAFSGAEAVEVHEMKMDGEKMIMRQVKDGLEIKPGETVTFSPGGFHLMVVGLKSPIVPGDNIKGSLTFEKAGSVDVTYKVESLGATSSSDADASGMKHDHAQ